VGLFGCRDGTPHIQSSRGFRFAVPVVPRFPLIRAVGNERVLVIDSRTTENTANAHIFSHTGETLAVFRVGDGVQDVIVLETTIGVTYFDEGVFGRSEPANEGVAFFGLDGQLSWGYLSEIGPGAVDVADCYAACRAGRNQLAFCPYTDFPLVELDPRKRSQSVFLLPQELHGASALSRRGPHTFFHGPYGRKHSILRWSPGEAPSMVGSHAGPLRGLDAGRFLSKTEHGFTIVEVE
jgi:hypothetical protein